MSENIYNSIDDLLVKFMLGEASPEETQQVENWIASSEENRKYYGHFMQIWQQSQKLAPAYAPSEQEAWLRLKQRFDKSPGKTRVISMSFRKAMRVAAIFLIIVSAYFVIRLVNNSSTEQITLASGTSILIDTLPDGSAITLNKNSSLAFEKNLTGNERKVRLNGEAFFKVTPNKQKPFIINTQEAAVTVTGTSFNVSSKVNITTVIVETGSVTVSNGQRSVNLSPGEKLSLGKNDTLLKKQKETNLLYNYYRTREFVCNNTPLYELTAKLSEAYSVNFKFANDGIGQLKLNTTFYNQPLSKILDIVCTTFSLQWEQSGNTILLK